MTAPASDPRLVALLGEHVRQDWSDRTFECSCNPFDAPGWKHAEWTLDQFQDHLAAEVEAHVQERIAEAEKRTLLDAADAIQALHPGEVKNSVIFLRDRAAAHRPDEGAGDE